MATNRKRKASRKNAENTRPSTNPDLRRKVSLNALQHGFSANTFVLSNEERPLYEELLQGFIDDLQPANTIEMECIYDMVGAKWRLRRILSVESDIFAMQINHHKPPTTPTTANKKPRHRIWKPPFPLFPATCTPTLTPTPFPSANNKHMRWCYPGFREWSKKIERMPLATGASSDFASAFRSTITGRFLG